jgi:hypothetical protein
MVPKFTFGVLAQKVNGFSAVSTGFFRFLWVFVPQKLQNRQRMGDFRNSVHPHFSPFCESLSFARVLPARDFPSIDIMMPPAKAS